MNTATNWATLHLRSASLLENRKTFASPGFPCQTGRSARLRAAINTIRRMTEGTRRSGRRSVGQIP